MKKKYTAACIYTIHKILEDLVMDQVLNFLLFVLSVRESFL